MRLNEVKQLTESESSRGKEISKEEAIELLQTHFSSGVKRAKSGFKLYRGVRNDGEIMLYDTMAAGLEKRKNANTDPFVNEIISKSEHWKNFPQRDQSLICSLDPSYAGGYGNLFVVIPRNKTLIGVVDDQDFWNAFDGSEWGIGRIGEDYGVGEMRRIVKSTVEGSMEAIESAIEKKYLKGKERLKRANELHVELGRTIQRQMNLTMLRRIDELIKETTHFFAVESGIPGGMRLKLRQHIKSHFSDYAVSLDGVNNILVHGFVHLFDEILGSSEKLHAGPIESVQPADYEGECWFAGQALLIAQRTFFEIIEDMEK